MRTTIKRIFGAAICGGLAAGMLVIACAGAVQAAATNQSLAVPLYEQPGKNSFWDDVRGAGAASVPFVVANPANGPGGAAQPAYIDALSKNDTAGIKTLGYVQTNYQARNFKDVYAEIDAWYRLYPMTKGIAIDLVKEGGPAEVCYVAGLYSHIKNTHPNDLVVLNPGGHISGIYEPYSDIFVNAQGDYGSYQAWTPQYKGFEDRSDYQNRFWHIVYGVTAAQYNDAFERTRNNNAGWVYLTDKSAPTPFGATPWFWQQEAADVGTLPASVVPNRGKTSLPRGCISLSASADSTIDTTAPKQSSTQSSIAVSNVSAAYDSEAATSLQIMSLPQGVVVSKLSAPSWSCDLTAKSCTYDKTLAAGSSLAAVAAALNASCDYSGGDALARLTNYAGNRWDVKLPVRPPFGCDPASPAGKLNQASSGQIITLTTQSIETTPAIAPLSAADKTPEVPTVQSKSQSLPAGTIALLILVILLIFLVVGGGFWWWHRRNRYRVKM